MNYVTEIIRRHSRNADRGHVQRALMRAGILMDDAHTGHWKMERLRATVRMETSDFLRIRANIDAPDNPLVAFKRQLGMSGNIRFGIASTGWQIAADTRIDGVAHLPRSLREIQSGFRRLLTGNAASIASSHEDGRGKPPERQIIEKQLYELAEETVETGGGWEIRPRCEGVSIPVELSLTDTGARFRSVLLSHLPRDLMLSAVVDQALRFNYQLRFCRLNIVNEMLVAESALNGQLMSSGVAWLRLAVRAVATARHRLRDPLCVLAEQTEVARCYGELFLNS